MWCVISGSVVYCVRENRISNRAKEFGRWEGTQDLLQKCYGFWIKEWFIISSSPKCIHIILILKSLLLLCPIGGGGLGKILVHRHWEISGSHCRIKVQHYKLKILNDLTPFLKSLTYTINMLLSGMTCKSKTSVTSPVLLI